MITPRDTTEELEKLQRNYGFSDADFRVRHHMGHSISQFQKYCRSISAFRARSKNRDLAEWIHKVLSFKTSPRQ